MSDLYTVKLPDIGDFSEVEVIEIHIRVGDKVAAEESLVTLESDKATMDVPCPESGEVAEILISIGDKISEGDSILALKGISESEDDPESAPDPADIESQPDETLPQELPAEPAQESQPAADSSDPFAPKRPPILPPPVERAKGTLAHASPAVRRFARELGADLSKIRGTGAKGRIVKEDVQLYVKSILQGELSPARGGPVGPPPIPEVDFTQFGLIESISLSKIKRITGDRLHRSWLDIPHVTHHDEADISELEIFRKAIDAEERISGTRVTILAFICKAIINALQQYPNFNASLSPDRQSLILKKYFNIGVAVDTPNGLVVPVIRDIQKLGVLEIARTLQELGEKARTGKLTPSDFQGGCFTISSLGGIGGRFFTPIINPPEVAILGVSRNHQVAVPGNDGVEWKTMLPLSLSYDHRVIDGAEAARFVKFVCELLFDARRILL
ncbi:MAG: 2-oxo acid dehydrogenase subunit E2 [Acidiferrobacterales bacterium]|nr:2-oxo acid dehydrogenase subunit E2 [Acidiferrobacterales bacterium]